MSYLMQDLRYSLRILLRDRRFSIAVIAIMALGIGTNTAIFSLVNGILLRPLPYGEPEQLVKISFNNPGVGLQNVPFSMPELEDVKSRSGVFSQVSVVWPSSANLTGADHPVRLEILGVSPNYFSMLAVKPEKGRLFGPMDYTPGFSDAVVISDALWTRSYGRDPNILSRNLQLDNDLYHIVGVLPPDFRHPGRTVSGNVEVWATAGFSADPFPVPTRRARILPEAIGRLKPGISLAAAQNRLDMVSHEIRSDYSADYPAQDRWTVQAASLQESLVGNVRSMLIVLFCAVIMMVLVGSVNVANLLLARAATRQREIALRVSLGATRLRIFQQLLTESIFLAVVSGIVGILASFGILRFGLALVPAKIPRLTEVHMDWSVLLFALVVSVITGTLFGLPPALQAYRTELSSTIREGSIRSGFSRKNHRIGDGLIVAELALTVVLMISGGLLSLTFWRLLEQDPGFNPADVVTASMWLPIPNTLAADKYDNLEVRSSFIHEALQRVGSLPGVRVSAMTTALPATGQGNHQEVVLEGVSLESNQGLSAEVVDTTPDYFKVLESPLVRGRFVDEGDGPGKPDVALVDETAARRFWPGQDPIGRRFQLNRNRKLSWITVVGIVKDMKIDGLDAAVTPHVYGSMYQHPGRSMNLVLRTALPAGTLEPQIKNQIQPVDPDLPVFNVRSMTDIIDVSVGQRRFSAQLVGAFAILSLLLASVGIYGLLAYMVGQRSQELGIRMALGATRQMIRSMVLLHGAILGGIGIALGLALSAMSAPLIAGLLYGVHPFNPIVIVTVPVVLMLVVMAASYVPAHRATKLDPMLCLRSA